jgi:hypothetical protein
MSHAPVAVPHQPRMHHQPSAHVLALMRPCIIAAARIAGGRWRPEGVAVDEQGDERGRLLTRVAS